MLRRRSTSTRKYFNVGKRRPESKKPSMRFLKEWFSAGGAMRVIAGSLKHEQQE